MRPRHTIPAVRTGLHAALLVAATTSIGPMANGDIAWSSYIDEDTFAYIVQDMPDFDQVRNVLPNTGKCYCGPAATCDLLGYAATHGFPEVDPGIPLVSWHGPASYHQISVLMADIGNSTGTNPGPGVSCGVGQAALYDELVTRLGDQFTVRNCYRDFITGYAPDTAEIAFRGVQDQAVGLMLYGRWAGDFLGEAWVSDVRRGGHFEAVNRAVAGGGFRNLGLRNPVSNDQNTSQSTFATHWFDVTRRVMVADGSLMVVDQLNDMYTVKLDTDGDGRGDSTEKRMRIFEGYLNIAPKACYAWDDFTESVYRLTPGATEWSARSHASEPVSLPGRPDAIAFGPSDLTIASIVDGKVLKTRRGTIGKNAHQTIEVPDDRWTAAADLAFDTRRRLHVVGGDLLASFDWDRGEHLVSVQLPGEGTSIAVENGIVHVLVPELEMVVAVDHGPDGPVVVELPLPEDAVVEVDSSITMLPGGRLFLLTNGQVNPMQINDFGFMRLWVPVPRDGDWARISADDNGMLCMVDRGGRVEAYRFTANGFLRNEQHPMEGVQVGEGPFTIAASTSNLRPELEADAWIGSEDEFDDRAVEVDCPGDLDFDGKVDSADMGLLLGMWGERQSIADLDGSDLVDSADLGLLLGYFGDCP